MELTPVNLRAEDSPVYRHITYSADSKMQANVICTSCCRSCWFFFFKCWHCFLVCLANTSTTGGRLEDNKTYFVCVLSLSSFHWVWWMAAGTERPVKVHLWLNLDIFLVVFWGTCKPPEEFKGISRITYINEIIVKKIVPLASSSRGAAI